MVTRSLPPPIRKELSRISSSVLPVAWLREGLELHLSLASAGAGIDQDHPDHAAGRVASVFFLVPPVTAVLAAGFLGATFTLQDGAGFGLAAAGVWLGQRA